MKALFLAATLAALASAAYAEKFVEGDGSNGYAVVLAFDSVDGPDADHSHWFYYPVRYQSKTACDAAANGDNADDIKDTVVNLLEAESHYGYQIKNTTLSCQALPADVTDIKNDGDPA